MTRALVPINVVFQIDNPVQPPAYGAPVLLTYVSVVLDNGGKAIYQPAPVQVPASSEDFTDDVLASLNSKLFSLGLKVVKHDI